MTAPSPARFPRKSTGPPPSSPAPRPAAPAALNPAPKEPVVVFCTSNGEAKDIHDGIAAGADDYIVKPFDEAALHARLEKLGRD
ncbi:response regulator [Erythrobacter donghaensis]|uniref:response regulator n=1 Tax=Erythrobacter donghaensis TaxID=267135 RepID=UPI003AF5ACA6